MAYEVVAICGSMKFTQRMLEVQEELSHKGYIALLPCFSPVGDPHQQYYDCFMGY